MTWPPRNKCADEKRPYAEGEEEEGGEEEARAQPLKSTKGAGAWGGGLAMRGCRLPVASRWFLSERGKLLGLGGKFMPWPRVCEALCTRGPVAVSWEHAQRPKITFETLAPAAFDMRLKSARSL